MIIDNLFQSIKSGKEGHNVGLPTGLPKMDNITFGTQRKWLTVVSGDSGICRILPLRIEQKR